MKSLRPGDRIRLIAMADDPDPILPGTTGTVVSVKRHEASPDNAWVQVDVDWDNGRTLMLSIPPDRVEILAAEADR